MFYGDYCIHLTGDLMKKQSAEEFISSFVIYELLPLLNEAPYCTTCKKQLTIFEDEIAEGADNHIMVQCAFDMVNPDTNKKSMSGFQILFSCSSCALIDAY